MELESDGVAGINAESVGGVYFAEGVLGSLVSGPPAEVEITWTVTSDPGDPVPHPDFPLKADQIPPYHVLGIVFSDANGLPTRFDRETFVHLALEFKMRFSDGIEWGVSAASTAGLAAAFDESMRSRRMPDGVLYVGMLDRKPTFLVSGKIKAITASAAAVGRGAPNLCVGVIYESIVERDN